MFFAGGLAGVLLLILWVYCILDVIATDEMMTRNMPKMIWLLVVIFVPTVGSIAWLALGRPERAGFRPGETTTVRPVRRVIGPEDSPEFMLRASEDAERLRRWEDDLRRREDDLKRREQGGE